ncbi:TonB-dependent receptor [Runella sp. MFBS21]|uniref:TonB-dependent receptor n=1 Tax=Runella sp. MFBS21 TaxID=3034018 RepID=UPI0023F73B8E|nr:TonB-dependent receptor [Runella sp. MFBS21]MDF7817560.1 TonB-dependent receptor [Runella sp. MFBS21]
MKKHRLIVETVIAMLKFSCFHILVAMVSFGISIAKDSNAQEILERPVSVEIISKDVQTALQFVEKSAKVKFSYEPALLPKGEKINLVVKNERLSAVLEKLLKPLRLVYTTSGKYIILTKETKQSFLEVERKPEPEMWLFEKTITGTVSDERGQGLPGVSVLVKGTQQGTSTDANGKYKLILGDAPTTLVFSYVGYVSREALIENRTALDIQLLPDEKALTEVVVVGYGTQQKEDITGAIATASAKELRDPPVAQVAQMLQGKLVGVRIDQVSGRPGEGMNIKVRGSVSITAGANPLYVVDGMPITGDINTINPNEIESISVLKDAAASSLYGSRAGNGVVLIQTKKAKAGKTLIDFSSYYGFTQIPEARRLKMMNAEEYAQFQKEIAESNGRAVNPAFQNPAQYAGKGTDWYDVVTRTGAIQSHNLSISSGTKNFLTSVTGGYFKEEGVVVGTGFQRLSLRVNSLFTPSEKVKIGFNLAPNFASNTNFATDGGPYGTENIISGALATSPLASPYNADGSLALTASDPASFGNPNWLRVAQEKVYRNKTHSLLSNAYVEYEIIKGLKAKTTANVQLSNNNIFQFNPSTIGVLFTPPPRIPSGSDNTTNMYNWVNENSLTYQTEFEGHQIDALVDFTAQRFRSDNNVISGTNYPDDKIQAVSAAGRVVVTSNVQEWALLSYLARLNYNYKSKYLLTASVRRDGSSRFGPNNRWGNFPSVSVGWIVSKEPFWTLTPVSFLKLRASYGITGNFEIGNYSFRSTVGSVFYAFGNSMFQGRAANNLGDNNLGWERKKQFNIGADVYLLNDRFQITYNYYRTISSNLLYNVSVPVSSGFSSIQTNIGELKFWGHEIGINTTNIHNEHFSWNTSLNMSFDRNRVEKLSTEKTTAIYQGMSSYGFFSHISQIGSPVGLFYGAVWDGVYKNQEEFNTSPKYADSQVGTIKYKDLNGDGKITFPEDYTTIGTPWPKFIFGLTNQIHYGNFDLGLTITGNYGNQILSHYENWLTNLDGPFNVLAEVKDRWKSPSDPGVGKYGSVQQGTTYLERDRWSTRYLKDGSFVSFKNITVGYNIPLNSRTIRNLRVYSSIQNAWVISKYPGNPEVNTRNVSSGNSPGVDEGSYPVPRTISFGLNLGF